MKESYINNEGVFYVFPKNIYEIETRLMTNQKKYLESSINNQLFLRRNVIYTCEQEIPTFKHLPEIFSDYLVNFQWSLTFNGFNFTLDKDLYINTTKPLFVFKRRIIK